MGNVRKAPDNHAADTLRDKVNVDNLRQHIIGRYICMKGDNHVILVRRNEAGNGKFVHAACDRAGCSLAGQQDRIQVILE